MLMHTNATDVLLQLKRGPVWDGDIISKAARDSLVKVGQVRRDRQFEDGPHAGRQKNELTELGATIAEMLHEIESRSVS